MRHQDVVFVADRKFLPWIVCLTAALFFFNDQFTTMTLLAPLEQIPVERYFLYYFYGNLFFLPVAGALLDRFSPKLIILSAIFLYLFTIFLPSYHLGGYFLFNIFTFIRGISTSFCFLSSMRLVSNWFSSKHYALVVALILTTLPGIAALVTAFNLIPIILLYIFKIKNVILAFYLIPIIGFAFFILFPIFFLVQDYPLRLEKEKKALRLKLFDLGWLKSWRIVYLNPQNLLCGLYTVLINLLVVFRHTLWINYLYIDSYDLKRSFYFLPQNHHFTICSTLSFFFLFGMMLGGLVIGWFSDKIKKRVKFMRISAFISLCLVLLEIFLTHFSHESNVIGHGILFALGFFNSSQILSYVLVIENNPKNLTATAVSVVFFFTIAGYALFRIFFYHLVKNQSLLYNDVANPQAITVILIGLGIALFTTLFMKDPEHIKQ